MTESLIQWEHAREWTKIPNEERFVPHVQYFSPVTRAMVPGLPESVLRIFDRQENDYVAHDAPRDPERFAALLKGLRAHGRDREH